MKASDIARTFSDEVASRIHNSINNKSKTARTARPKLVGFLCGPKDGPNATYAEWTSKACEAVGIEYDLRNIASEEDAEEAGGHAHGAAELEAAILEANSDP